MAQSITHLFVCLCIFIKFIFLIKIFNFKNQFKQASMHLTLLYINHFINKYVFNKVLFPHNSVGK